MTQPNDTTGNDELLQVRCEKSFKEKLRVEAAKAGQQMSQYVRSTLRESWGGTTHPDKDPDMSTCNPEPSVDSGCQDNSQNGEKSDPNAGGSNTESEPDTGETYQRE